jgi:hypothetical protein
MRRYGLFCQQTGNTMLSQLKAKLMAVHAAVGSPVRRSLWTLSLGAVTILVGCAPHVAPLSGADPADATARTAAVSYRSTLGRHSSLRPAAPTSWGDQNERVAPKPEPPQ